MKTVRLHSWKGCAGHSPVAGRTRMPWFWTVSVFRKRPEACTSSGGSLTRLSLLYPRSTVPWGEHGIANIPDAGRRKFAVSRLLRRRRRLRRGPVPGRDGGGMPFQWTPTSPGSRASPRTSPRPRSSRIAGPWRQSTSRKPGHTCEPFAAWSGLAPASPWA